MLNEASVLHSAQNVHIMFKFTDFITFVIFLYKWRDNSYTNCSLSLGVKFRFNIIDIGPVLQNKNN